MNGQKETEITYKDGKAHGLETVWYDNGQKKELPPLARRFRLLQ